MIEWYNRAYIFEVFWDISALKTSYASSVYALQFAIIAHRDWKKNVQFWYFLNYDIIPSKALIEKL